MLDSGSSSTKVPLVATSAPLQTQTWHNAVAEHVKNVQSKCGAAEQRQGALIQERVDTTANG